MFTTVKKAVQIIPPINTVRETPKICARLPAIKFPKGIIPAKVNINTLIILPLNSSGTKICNKVFMRLVVVTEPQPTNIKAMSENKYILDKENNTNEREKIIVDEIRNLPLYLKSPKRANTNAAISAPQPAADISIPKPLTPTFNISLEKTGISIT